MSDIERRLSRMETNIKWLESNKFRIDLLEKKVQALQEIEGSRLVNELKDIPVGEPTEDNPFSIDDHELSFNDEYLYNPSPNKGGYFRDPELLTLHYTAGRSYHESIDNVFMNPEADASAHILIGKEAEVVQLVRFDTRAWHAGKSAWRGKKSVNGFSLSIELDNFGKLKRKYDAGVEEYKFYTWFDKEYKDPVSQVKIVDNNDKFWESYRTEQIDKLVQIIDVILNTYPSIKMIVGHEDISPGRKSDPGPAFPWEQLQCEGFPILDKYKTRS